MLFQINVLLWLLNLPVRPVDVAVKRSQKALYVSVDQLFFYISFFVNIILLVSIEPRNLFLLVHVLVYKCMVLKRILLIVNNLNGLFSVLTY